MSKSILATCGTDKVIKIWDYSTFKMLYEYYMDKSIYSISFHPTGFHLAVCTKDRLILINLLINKM